MVSLRYGGGQRGRLGLQVTETQGQREGQGERVWDGEGGGEEEEEDEEEAGDERGGLDRQEVLGALRQEAHLGQIREREVAVFVQNGGQIGEVQRDGEQPTPMRFVSALFQTLFTRGQQQRLFLQQRGFPVSPGLPTLTTLAVFDRADRRGALPRGVFPPTPEFVGYDRGGGEGQLVVQIALACGCAAIIIMYM